MDFNLLYTRVDIATHGLSMLFRHMHIVNGTWGYLQRKERQECECVFWFNYYYNGKYPLHDKQTYFDQSIGRIKANVRVFSS